MKIIPWQLPLKADWTRALMLKQLSLNTDLVLIVEDELDALWRLTFSNIQAVKIITEECSGSIEFPEPGGLFEVLQSTWIKELGSADFLDKSHHYIICCYDQVIEVVTWDFDVQRLENTGHHANEYL